MLLRRITKHVTDQNWFAVFIDFLIVVVGVFIGIQVANWNETRKDDAQEKDYLIRLHEDFVANADGIQRDNNFHQQQLDDQSVVIDSLTECKVKPEHGMLFQRGINQLGYINPPRFMRRTLNEMTASGNLDIIKNEAIRDHIAQMIFNVEFRDGVSDGVMRTTEHYRYIVEENIQYDVKTPLEDSFSSSLAVIYDINKLCENPKIASAVSAISLATRERISAYNELLEMYQAFLPKIEDELFNRWQYKIEFNVEMQ
jgi:hypothetical protein